jgi:hypothetical protein
MDELRNRFLTIASILFAVQVGILALMVDKIALLEKEALTPPLMENETSTLLPMESETSTSLPFIVGLLAHV